MAPSQDTTPKKAKSIPKTVADFTVLPLSLPKLSGLPAQHSDARHYLYVKQHEPSIPSAQDERSLFIANVPIDATEGNMRSLFADRLGGAMVERVEFDGSIPAAPMHKRWKADKATNGDTNGEMRGKKRKRANDEAMVAEGVVEDEDSMLPRLWSSEVRRSGSGAVVVFVDKKSARGALKEIIKAVKENKSIAWKGGEGLGEERKSFLQHHLCTKKLH